jgi:hypothetical protein
VKSLQRCFEEEVIMDRLGIPSKEQVREWLREGVAQHRPPPDAIEIRQQLQWRLSEEKYQEWRLRRL